MRLVVDSVPAQLGQVFLKTKLCQYFLKNCNRGHVCPFAHGPHELGTPQPTEEAIREFDLSQMDFGSEQVAPLTK